VSGRAAACASALRAASDPTAWRAARDTLAGALRAEALHVLTANGIPAHARDDLAQAVTVAVLERIVDGGVAHGHEDGYVGIAARNRARDWHREQSGVYEKSERLDQDGLPAPDLDPHAALERAENEQRMRALAERVARLLETAPARYRDVLVAVYLEGVPIDTLVDQELFEVWPTGDDALAVRRRARARVDKLLQRARDWMRARLVMDDAATATARGDLR
jgi:DNA-directed RNA polymerase specialized sigma24 family protein